MSFKGLCILLLPTLVQLARVTSSFSGGSSQDPTDEQSCMKMAKGWLPDDGVQLCSEKRFAEVSQQVACVEKAYYPFYRSNGLNWNKVPAVQKAMELCKAADFDADEALRRSECSVRAWSSGDAARAGCLTMPLEVISNYTDCITSVQGWLGEDGVDLCLKRQFATASLERACVANVYLPFYHHEGLDWNKATSVAKAIEFCKKTGFDMYPTLQYAECVVRSVRDSRKDMGAAEAQCDHYLELIRKRQECVTETQKLLYNMTVGANVVESICKKSRFDVNVSASVVACFSMARSHDDDGSGVLDSFTCMERIWRNMTGCTDQLFGPVGDSKRIVFIVDISGSMDTQIPGKSTLTRLGLMKSELADVLKTIHMDRNFTVLAFNTYVNPLPGGWMQASESKIAAAVAWINDLTASGQTNIEKALQQGMDMDGVESVHLLSDGMPNAGCTHVSCLPLSTGVPVHTTLLFPGAFENSDRANARKLLQDIADATSGTFREPQIG